MSAAKCWSTMRRSSTSCEGSWLIVPCDDARQIAQAAASAADVVVLDLMEFVPEGVKAAALCQARDQAKQQAVERAAALHS